VLDDVRSVVKVVGGEKAAKKINDELKEKLGEKGFEGLDLDRPILGYVLLGGQIEDTVVVVAVPMTGENSFLALLERFSGMKFKADEQGFYEFPVPGEEVKAFMRFEGQHAYFAIGKNPAGALNQKALVAASKLYDPSEKALASLKVHVNRLPKATREQLAEGLKKIQDKLEALRLPADAGEPARKAVDELVKLGKRYANLLEDAETAGARLFLDPKTAEVALEVGLTGRPGSDLAKVIGERKPSTNKFAGLITPDTAAGLKLQLPFFAPEIQDAAVIGLEAGQKALEEKVPEQFKAVITETFKGLIRTVKDGEADITVALRGPDKDGLYTIVGAVAFEDPSGLEKEVRTLIEKELPPRFKEMVKLDVAKVGKTNIHQVKLGALLPPEAQKAFGEDASVAFAFAPNGIFVAFGPGSVDTLKTALEVKKTQAPPLEVLINPNRLGKFITALGGELPAGFGKEDKLISTVALTLEGGKELRLRLTLNLKGIEGIGGFGSADSPE
jgi:hypothetical protein